MQSRCNEVYLEVEHVLTNELVFNTDDSRLRVVDGAGIGVDYLQIHSRDNVDALARLSICRTVVELQHGTNISTVFSVQNPKTIGFEQIQETQYYELN